MDDSSELNDQELEIILRDALKLKLKDSKKIPSRQKLNGALTATISEFLTCYKLIGFDLEGNPIKITIANNTLEKAAIANAFMEEISKFINDKSF